MLNCYSMWIPIVIAFHFPGTSATAAEIYDAARDGNLTRMESIIVTDPSQLHAIDREGGTPLHLAALPHVTKDIRTGTIFKTLSYTVSTLG